MGPDRTADRRAVFEGPERTVHVRVAGDRGAMLLDLGDPEWRVVRVDAAGWDVLSCSPVPLGPEEERACRLY